MCYYFLIAHLGDVVSIFVSTQATVSRIWIKLKVTFILISPHDQNLDIYDILWINSHLWTTKTRPNQLESRAKSAMFTCHTGIISGIWAYSINIANLLYSFRQHPPGFEELYMVYLFSHEDLNEVNLLTPRWTYILLRCAFILYTLLFCCQFVITPFVRENFILKCSLISRRFGVNVLLFVNPDQLSFPFVSSGRAPLGEQTLPRQIQRLKTSSLVWHGRTMETNRQGYNLDCAESLTVQ